MIGILAHDTISFVLNCLVSNFKLLLLGVKLRKHMGPIQLPKVSKILSSRPISECAAFQMVSKFLEKEQRRLDAADLHRSGHWGDVFLVCEALSKSEKERSQLEKLKKSSQEQTYDESQTQLNSSVSSPAIPTRTTATAMVHDPTEQSQRHMQGIEESLSTNQENVAISPDEQTSSLEVKKEKGDESSYKRKLEKKAKKEKKKRRRQQT